MQTLQIDPEFQSLIPPLSEEEYMYLQCSIAEDGCRDPIVTWEGVIIDGHNRYEICNHYDLPFETKEMRFKDRTEVREWIIKNQLGRRNLEPGARIALAKRLEDSIAERARRNQALSSGDRKSEEAKSLLQNSAEAIENNPVIDTRAEIAKLAGVSHDTVQKYNTIEREAPSLLPLTQVPKSQGGMSINAAYNSLPRFTGPLDVAPPNPKKKKEKPPAYQYTPEEQAQMDAINAEYAERCAEIERQKNLAHTFNVAIFEPSNLEITDNNIETWLSFIGYNEFDEKARQIESAVHNLSVLDQALRQRKRPHLVKGGFHP